MERSSKRATTDWMDTALYAGAGAEAKHPAWYRMNLPNAEFRASTDIYEFDRQWLKEHRPGRSALGTRAAAGLMLSARAHPRARASSSTADEPPVDTNKFFANLVKERQTGKTWPPVWFGPLMPNAADAAAASSAG